MRRAEKAEAERDIARSYVDADVERLDLAEAHFAEACGLLERAGPMLKRKGFYVMAEEVNAFLVRSGLDATKTHPHDTGYDAGPPPEGKRCESFAVCEELAVKFRESCLLWECEKHLAISHDDPNHNCCLK